MSLETLIVHSTALGEHITAIEACLNARFRHSAHVQWIEATEDGPERIVLAYERRGKTFCMTIQQPAAEPVQFTSAPMRYRCLAVLRIEELVAALVREQDDAEEMLEAAAGEALRVRTLLARASA